MHQAVVGSDKYSFIAVDASPYPGFRQPYNFFGSLDNVEIGRLNKFANKSRESKADFIIWFGHWPTSSVLNNGNERLRDVIGKFGITFFLGPSFFFPKFTSQKIDIQRFVENLISLFLSD